MEVQYVGTKVQDSFRGHTCIENIGHEININIAFGNNSISSSDFLCDFSDLRSSGCRRDLLDVSLRFPLLQSVFRVLFVHLFK